MILCSKILLFRKKVVILQFISRMCVRATSVNHEIIKNIVEFMKKYFFLLMMLFVAFGANATAYYVAGTGSATNNFAGGKNWNAAGSAMADNGDGTHSVTYTNVPAGTYQFKVTDGTWNNSWGSDKLDKTCSSAGATTSGSNVEFTSGSTGDVTITFTESTKKICVTFPIVIPTVLLAGEMTDWLTNALTLTDADDHLSASVVVNLSAQDYTFKMVKGGTWLGNTGAMTRANCSGWTFESLLGNCTITADVAGDYTFTFVYATNKLTVTYPAAPEPGPTVYYIKNGWKGGDWAWAEMTPNGDESEWTYTDVFGGTGVNINTAQSDADARWFDTSAIIGGDAISAGDEVTFTYNVAANTVTAQLVTPVDPSEIKYYIKNGWNGGEWTWQEMTPNDDKSEWTYTGVFGGSGVNISMSQSGGTWIPVGEISGDAIGAGNNVTFTYTVEGATLSAQNNDRLALSAIRSGLNMATFYSDKEWTVADAAWVYTALWNDGHTVLTLTKHEQHTIPANEGVMIVSESLSELVLLPSATEASFGPEANSFLGATTATATDLANNTYYILAKNGENPVFKKYTGASIPAGKAYLMIEGAAAAPAMFVIEGLDVENELTTAVADVLSAEPTVNGIFTILGAPVKDMSAPGIYVKNGKKIIVK